MNKIYSFLSTIFIFLILNICSSNASTREYYDTVIIGGGLSGLTTAYALKKNGFNEFKVFEAKNRLGGRVYTHYEERGNFVELGGERIRSNGTHKEIITLCKELNVDLIEEVLPSFMIVTSEGNIFKNDLARDFIKKCINNYSPPPHWPGKTLEDFINESFSEADNKSFIKVYLAEKGYKNLQRDVSHSLAKEIDLIIKELNFLTLPAENLKGDYEEISQFRITNGNNKLILKLLEYIDSKNITLEHILKKLSRTQNNLYEMVFITPEGVKSVLAHKLILTVPFSVLRTVELDSSLYLPSLTLNAINTLPYAQHSKVCCPLTSASWEQEGSQSMLGIDAKRSALIWCNSFNQSHHGITFYYLNKNPFLSQSNPLFYSHVVERESIESSQIFLSDYERNGYSFDKNRKIIGYNWPEDPYAVGSYSQRKLLESKDDLNTCSKRNPNRLAFADPIDLLFFGGEHTQVVEGYMNSAVVSGFQIADDIISLITKDNQTLKSAIEFEIEREEINIPLVYHLLQNTHLSIDQRKYLLSIAIEKNCPIKIIEKILESESSISVNEYTKNGESLLSHILFSDKIMNQHKTDLADLLIIKGADIDQKLNNKNTMLHRAIIDKKWTIAKYLINKKANATSKNANDETPLILWRPNQSNSISGQWDVLNLLICFASKEELDKIDQDERSLLLMTLYAKKTKLAIQLIEKGASVNIQDLDEGFTPLHIAVQKEWKEIVDLLIHKGADISIKDNEGKTPYEYKNL